MNLIPKPKNICITGGQLKPGEILTEKGELVSIQVEKACERLNDDIRKKGLCGAPVKLLIAKSVNLTDVEEYALKINEDGIHIQACHAKGVFYALQTLRQIICTEGCFPYCEIYDKPDFMLRGLLNDTTRGRVPTLEGLKKIADFCAYFKLNIIVLYFEHSFGFREYEGIVSAEECLSPSELKEFVKYCGELYVDIIPCAAMFGHLYKLLQSDKYKHLCELENYIPTRHYWTERAVHHTLDVSNPESHELMKSFIDQLAEVFPYNLYYPGTDETFDLCKGKNKDKNMIEEYCSFNDEVCNYLATKGKRGIIDDDIMQKENNGFLLKSDNIIIGHWDYANEPDEKQFEVLRNEKLPFVVINTTWSFNSLIENTIRSKKNIYNSIELGKKYNSVGIINSIWGDGGHWCDFNCTLYGVVMGAAKSWNTETVFDENFEKDFSRIVYNEENENITKLISRFLSMTENAAIYYLVKWYNENVLSGNKTPLMQCAPNLKPKEIALEAAKLSEYVKELGSVHKEKEELYESFYASLGACEALNILSDAIVAERILTQEERAIIEKRMCEYHRVWIRDNKEGEFYEIKNFIDGIIAYLDK